MLEGKKNMTKQFIVNIYVNNSFETSFPIYAERVEKEIICGDMTYTFCSGFNIVSNIIDRDFNNIKYIIEERGKGQI